MQRNTTIIWQLLSKDPSLAVKRKGSQLLNMAVSLLSPENRNNSSRSSLYHRDTDRKCYRSTGGTNIYRVSLHTLHLDVGEPQVVLV